MRNSRLGRGVKGLLLAGTMLVPGLAGATITVYSVTSTANLVNQAFFCGGANDRYNGCTAGIPVGFNWTSAIPAGDTINSVLVEFNDGVECHGTGAVMSTTLNAATAGTWTVNPTDCFCVPLQKVKSVNVAAAGLAAYVKNGLNTFLTTNVTTCIGNSPSVTLGNAFARITVDHGVGGPVNCATTAQAAAIEAKLDDGTRFQSDAERTAETTVLNTGINRLETKLDDGTRFTSDAERTAQTTAILTPVAALEAKADDISSDSETTQRLLIEDSLLKIDRTSIIYLPAQCGGKLEVIRGIVDDVITKNQACNVAVGTAPATLAEGDAEYALGNWKNAFDKYRQAYRMVATGL
jgi:hypothetical protein